MAMKHTVALALCCALPGALGFGAGAPGAHMALRGPAQAAQPAGASSRRAALDVLASRLVRAAAGAALVPAVGQPREAWAMRSFEEFAADKARRTREPGEIKEGEVLFDFEARVPLGLDLTEVRISQENGGPRVAIKGIKPEGQAAAMEGVVPGLILEVVQGESVAGMTPEAAIKLVLSTRKKLDAEGKNLKLVFSRGTVLQRFEIQEQREKEVAKLRKEVAKAMAADK